MEDLQGQIQKGVSSLKKGFQGGKEKLQTSQEVMSLKQELTESENKRTGIILEIGELVYLKLRSGEISIEECTDKFEQLKSLDRQICSTLKSISEKTKINQNQRVCECGNSLNDTDKFCVSCGRNVEIVEEEIEDIVCNVCEELIPIDSKYCGCCGYKIV